MDRVTSCAVLVVLLGLSNQALGDPPLGSNCTGCHRHETYFPGATTVINADATAAPNPANGALKVFRVEPGQTRALQFEVGGWTPNQYNTTNVDKYSTAFRNFAVPGLGGNTLKFTAGSGWTRKTGTDGIPYYYNPVTTYLGGKQSFAFNITIDPTTKPDYYLLDFMTATRIPMTGVPGQIPGYYGLEKFYLQVVPEPMTLAMLGLGAGVLAITRRRGRANC